MSTNEVKTRISVFYDGKCRLCVALADEFSRLNSDKTIQFVDMHDIHKGRTAKDRFTDKQLNDSMVTHMPDGSWRTGYFAVAELFLRLHHFSTLGKLMLFPLFYGIGPAVYNVVARNRQALSKYLLPKRYHCNDQCMILME